MLEEKIKQLKGKAITRVDLVESEISIQFDNGSIGSSYWRVSGDSIEQFSMFDVGQKYGMDCAPNYQKNLIELLLGRAVQKIELNSKGDILLHTNTGVLVEIFNFSGYEVWEVQLPDKSEYVSTCLF